MRNNIGTKRGVWRVPGAILSGALVVTGATSVSTGQPAAAPTSSNASPGVPVEQLDLLDEKWGDDETREDEKASAETGRWVAAEDSGSLVTAAKRYGARWAWSKSDPRGAKVTGEGVDVALIDTGIAPVPGLDGSDKVVNGPDLSFESQHATTRHLDGHGHGTHMAGIIAGRDQAASPEENGGQRFAGIAPGARLVNMKVATADGGADVSQIIAAIDWVVQHRRDDGLNIRVINLSYGTHSTQPYTVDPLAYAVENAWRKGIVVVTAAGNDGTGAGLTMPAADPYGIAVGAVDHLGTKTLQDDARADFSSTGTAARGPDLLAPGKSVVSLRTPGSYSDRGHPEGLVTGDLAQRYFRGSGTSQAAAMVSGAAALLLQQRPDLTPDQVKYLLSSSADPVRTTEEPVTPGVLDIKGAFRTATPSMNDVRQSWPAATGTGTLEASRGTSHVVDPITGQTLTSEVDALGNPWDARSWREATDSGTAWTGGTWNGGTWTGDDWTGTSWTARSWREATWSGTSWAGGDWLARSWRGDTWTASGWSSLDLGSRSWSQDGWKARSWRDHQSSADDAG